MGERDASNREDDVPGPRGLDSESSSRLLLRARRGDPKALERLCERCLPRLRRWASGRLPRWARDMLDTDDLVQETLLRTIQGLDRFEPRHDGALHAYLRQALLNKIRDVVRGVRRQPLAGELDGTERDPGPSPLESAIGGENLERYETALSKLRDEEREAIILRLEMGFSYREIAAALARPTPDAARMFVGRAIVRLAEEMDH